MSRRTAELSPVQIEGSYANHRLLVSAAEFWASLPNGIRLLKELHTGENVKHVYPNTHEDHLLPKSKKAINHLLLSLVTS